MSEYSNLCAYVFNEPWVIMPEKMMAIAEALNLRLKGERLAEEEVALIAGSPDPPKHEAGQSVAVIPIFGTMTQHGSWLRASGGASTEAIAKDFRKALANPEIGTIVLEINSPGGSVYGVQELADLIYNSRSQKRTVAVANSMAASAAYWVASAAHEIVVTPGGEVGSIGVVTIHQDVSKASEQMGVKTTLVATPARKVLGNPYEPLSDAALSEISERNQEIYERFVAAVARGRGVKPAAVKAGFGGGGMVPASKVVAEQMADRVATMDEVVASILKGGRHSNRRAHNAAAIRLATFD